MEPRRYQPQFNEHYKLARGVTIEPVGPEFLALVPGSPGVLRLSGKTARALQQITAGGTIWGVQPETLMALEQAGVIVRSGPTRRAVLTSAAVAAGAGISSVMLPSAALASSGPTNYSPPGDALVFTGYSEWGRVNWNNTSVGSPYSSSGTHYFFYVDKQPDPPAAPTLKFKGYADSAPANFFTGVGGAMWFIPIASLSPQLAAYLKNQEGNYPADAQPNTLPNDFLYVEWDDDTFEVRGTLWYA